MMNIQRQPTTPEESVCFVDFEADTTLFLPRNLSYADDSYLNNYSVSSNFVFSPSKTKERKCNFDVDDEFNMAFESEISVTELNVTLSADDDKQQGCGMEMNEMNTCQRDCTFSGDSSDHTSEEGIFINGMDDLDSVSSSNGKYRSEDDALLDSINSTDESDLDKSAEGGEATPGETVSEVIRNLDKLVAKENIFSIDGKVNVPRSPPPQLKLTVSDEIFVKTEANEGNNINVSHEPSRLDVLLAVDDVDDDDEFQFDRAKLRKCSSLKTNKTPPGTPHRKKMVRFADAMGLDLESVRHVLNADAPPKIPPSAMKDLHVGIEEDRKNIGNRYLTSCFPQPGASEDFLKIVMAQKVCLENAVVTNLTITGIIRVANIGFHKVVRIRYTTNDWVTFHDIMASYVLNSCDGPTDRFSFSLVAPADFGVNARLQFAVSYSVGEAVYWDNNQNANYVFECFAKTTPTEAEDSWDSQTEDEDI